MEERYELTIERIMGIIGEETVAEPYRAYFQHVAEFLLKVDKVRTSEKQEKSNTIKMLYEDVLPENYETSYANPEYALQELGQEIGFFLSALYVELRSAIGYAYEGRLDYIVILNELFVEIYNRFEAEEVPEISGLKESFYWYASDYCDVFAADKVRAEISPEFTTFAKEVLMECDLENPEYLYQYGEYVGNEALSCAQYLRERSEDEIAALAERYTDRQVPENSVIDISYSLGMERLVKKVIENYSERNVSFSIYRTPHSLITRYLDRNDGFSGDMVNPQYEYDHRDDLGMVLDKQFVERRLEVIRTVLEQNKEQAERVSRMIEIHFCGGEQKAKEKNERIQLNEVQEELLKVLYEKEEQLRNQYISNRIIIDAPFEKQVY